jgi:hypothetical protein
MREQPTEILPIVHNGAFTSDVLVEVPERRRGRHSARRSRS